MAGGEAAAAKGSVDAEVIIAGGGIAGLATALALRRAGVARDVVVLERHAELRDTGAALTIFPNGWFALGVAHKLTPRYEPYERSRVTNLETGTTQAFRFAGNKDSCEEVKLRPMDRKALLQALADELPPGTIRFSSKLVSIHTEPASGADSSETVVARLGDGTVIRGRVLIGCDGVHSVVARWLGLSEPVSSGRSAVRGLSVFPGGHGAQRELRQFLSEGLTAGMVPISDTEMYWFLINNTVPAATPAEGISSYVAERRWRVTWMVVGAYLSGWVQQGGTNPSGLRGYMIRCFRDWIFYRFVSPRLADTMWFNCGNLTPHKEGKDHTE